MQTVQEFTPAQRKRVISSVNDIPAFQALLSGIGGKFEVQESMRRMVAVLESNDGGVYIVVSEDFIFSNQYLTLKDRIRRYGIKVIEEIVTNQGVVMMIYSTSTVKRELTRETENPDIQKLIEYIVGEAMRNRATDIHICPRFDAGTGVVLFRVDGKVYKFEQFPADKLLEACGYIFTKMAEESSRSEPSFNRYAMQSCSVPMSVNNQSIKLRYQSARVLGGIDVILRILLVDRDEKTLKLSDLGYSPTQCHELELASRKTVGVIIVSGVTGSGKSTTLKTLMSMSPSRHQIKSYSVEDPVEYKIYGVSQISVQRSSSDVGGPNPFVESIRVLLRADPDVIMVGEIRDAETASVLKQVVQTGHQVMTTVHAASAVEIIERITSEELGLLRQTISTRNFLSALVYQKLLPVNCPTCKRPAKDHDPRQRLSMIEKKFGLDVDKIFLAGEDPGCPTCQGRGIRGQTVASEIIMPDGTFLKLVREGRDSEAEEYWRGTRKSAFDSEDTEGKTAFEHGMYKVSIGMVDPANLEDAFEPIDTYKIQEIG